MFETYAKFLRITEDWSQNTVATVVDLPQPEYGLIESARLVPRPAQLERLSRFYGVPREQLLKPVGGPLENRDSPSRRPRRRRQLTKDERTALLFGGTETR